MRTFETGATRDEADCKPRYSGYLSPAVIQAYGRYMMRHQVCADGTFREPDNWKRGIPESAYLDSLVRHTVDLWRGSEDEMLTTELTEELCCAIMFNVMGLLYERLKSGP